MEIKALSTEPKMTVREVSEILKVSDKHVRKTVSELFPEKMTNGKTTYLNETEVTAVKIRIEKNPYLNQSVQVQTSLEKRMIVQQALMILNEEVRELQSENESIKIELDESKKWYSVKRVKNLGYLEALNARNIWNPLKKWSIENDYQIISIFDANYGEVKTYHADAWKAVYGVNL